MKYKILVTNDDSLKYEGIKVLTTYAKEFASEIMVVAPHTEKSACSHALTLRSEIKLYEEADLIPGVKTYTIDGTPADCVKFAKDALNYDFDIVFNAIENKDIESLWNYYKINIKRIHNVLIDRFWPIYSLYSQYFNICLDFDRLRQPYNKEDIFELMLLFLTCVCIENKRDGLNIPEEKKYRIQQYIKSIKYNT